jgi:hypothetical protein
MKEISSTKNKALSIFFQKDNSPEKRNSRIRTAWTNFTNTKSYYPSNKSLG